VEEIGETVDILDPLYLALWVVEWNQRLYYPLGLSEKQ
jgi:hypothetical protein